MKVLIVSIVLVALIAMANAGIRSAQILQVAQPRVVSVVRAQPRLVRVAQPRLIAQPIVVRPRARVVQVVARPQLIAVPRTKIVKVIRG